MIEFRAIISSLMLIANFSVYAQERVSFFEEHIDFELDSVYFSINGIYSFHNPTDKEINQRIVFPFSVETDQIDSISVINLENLNRIQFRRLKKTIVFLVNMPSRDTVDVNIFYRQKAVEKNTYIITSTRSWKQPLEKAVYTLTTSLPVNEECFSYPFISKETINDKILFRWEKTNFMPDKEFEIAVKTASR
ncbi:MAG: hypothetical protein FWF53_11820 [Candidatus Azobacteroides sp.]|nr:hypothetical protein [Candidatus Azobacteroides sp.]